MTRFTDDEIDAMRIQIQEDENKTYVKFHAIAKHISSISKYNARVAKSQYGVMPENRHVPFYYIEIPMCQYDTENHWIQDMLKLTGCEPPVAGIYIKSKGFI